MIFPEGMRISASPDFFIGGDFMELFLALLALMDDTIVALLGVPVFNILLSGSLILATLGVFLMLKDTATGQRQRRR